MLIYFYSLPPWWAFLSIQPPPDTVHTGLYLMVSMTFLLLSSQRPSDTVHSGSLPFVCCLDGLNLSLHPAAAWHGHHWIVLVGLVDLFITLLVEAVRYGTLWESSLSSVRCCSVRCDADIVNSQDRWRRMSKHDVSQWGDSGRGERKCCRPAGSNQHSLAC
jgi:hypothetical protein